MRSLLDLPDDLIRPEWRDCPVPGRPWWSETSEIVRRIAFPGGPDAVEFGRPRLQRRDGAYGSGSGGYAAFTETYDANNPLPHPRYRPGQIWGVAWRNVVLVLGPLASGDCARAEGVTDGPLLFALADVPGWEYARSCVSLADAWGPTTPPGGNEPGTFLLHDPLRPDLAPWSSPMSSGQRDPTTA